ncbi:MAG: DUF4129 domain-containing protein [Candidatus Tectomicrobia bacterium]
MHVANAPPAVPAAEEIQRVTREILSRPEFQPGAAWRDWMVAFIERVEDVFHQIASWSQAHPTLQWVVFVLLSLVLVLLVVHLVRTVRAEVWRDRHDERRRYAPASSAGSPEGVTRRWDEMLRQVRGAVSQGDGYSAIGLLHRFFLAVLHQRGILTFADWKTNADYLSECPRTHTAYATLADLTQAYERIVYAHRTVPLHTITDLLTQVEHDQHSDRS